MNAVIEAPPQVKERGILFNSDMVQAVLEGRKMQTRRVLRVDPNVDYWKLYDKKRGYWGPCFDKPHRRKPDSILPGGFMAVEKKKCPYGRSGDQLWVRETWQASPYDKLGFGKWYQDVPHSMRKPEAFEHLLYAADRSEYYLEDDLSKTRLNDYDYSKMAPFSYKPSIHMPRWASRIQLEVTDVRVERVQHISKEDAIAEGIASEHGMYWNHSTESYSCVEPITPFMALWDSINFDRGFGWDANPWVWVVEFRRIKPA